MSKTIQTTALKFKKSDGTYVSSNMLLSDGSLANKTEKQLLSYNGTNILGANGAILTYSQIHAMLMDSPDFVVLVYQDRAYHPNLITNEQIVFISSYVTGGHTQMERISISNEGLVTITHGVSEMVFNKTNSITDANKDNVDKYPSLKAVAEYVEPIAEEVEQLGDGLEEVTSSFNDISEKIVSRNIFPDNVLIADGIVFENGEYVGTAKSFNAAFKNGITGLEFDAGQRYTWSFVAYHEGESGTGNGLQMKFFYTDGTSNLVNCPNATTSPTLFAVTSSAYKAQVAYIAITASSSTSNVWHLSKVQLEKGATATEYVVHETVTAVDAVARDAINRTAFIADSYELAHAERRCATINFQFDDGNANDAIIASIFRAKGVRCGFALITTIDRTRLPEYKAYQNDGFEIISHSTDGTAMGENTTLTDTEIEQRMLESKKFFAQWGFKTRGWVTPNSTLKASALPIVAKYYDFATTDYYGVYSDTSRAWLTPGNKTIAIKRVSIQSNTLEQCKAAVDGAITNNGFLTFYGHSAQLDDGSDYETTDNINALLDYIIEKCANYECVIAKPSDAVDFYFHVRHNEMSR